jgi:GPI mannosyltransferase 2
MSKVKTFEKVKDSKIYLRDDVKSILKWTTFHRLLSISILLLSAKYMQHFDSSASLQLILDKESKNGLLRQYAFSTLRWDILHFLGVASPRPLPLSDQINPFIPIQQQIWSPLKGSGGGLRYENSIAFQPGIIWILRLTGYPLSMLQSTGQEKAESWNPIHSLCITSSLATFVSIVLPIQFYM